MQVQLGRATKVRSTFLGSQRSLGQSLIRDWVSGVRVPTRTYSLLSVTSALFVSTRLDDDAR